ncbi:MAG: prepilin-type N-terminal cleavage/methylation domain-containing protein [Planctomycetota bacterium]|nr:prepilin-type N-terminal cleavage/methylation domain-containing protein [Planctomycetota bacterium]
MRLSPNPAFARPGFSLLEVLMALALLVFGSVAVLSLFMNNLKTTRQAKEEVVLALLANEIQTRCQLAAHFAYDDADPSRGTFDGSAWLPRDPAAPDDPGAPLPGAPGTPERDAFNAQDWKIVKAAYDALAPESQAWDDAPIRAGYQFRLRTVVPPQRENDQFVDWDGYGWIEEAETGADLDGDGAPGAAEAGRQFGEPVPSHGVYYDPRGLRFYLKQLECVIGWDLQNPRDIFSGQYHVFQFTVYNPDARKRR